MRRASYSGFYVVQIPEKVTPGKHSQNKRVKRTALPERVRDETGVRARQEDLPVNGGQHECSPG